MAVRNIRARRSVSRVLSTGPYPTCGWYPGDGHSSGTPVAGRLAQPTRTTARKCAWTLPSMPSLFGFAPGGVYHAAPVARRAVRSYRTLSPLPKSSNPKGLRALAVCSLWHFPWGHPRRALPGTVLPWSPDFPPPCEFPHCMRATIRPSGRRVVGACSAESNGAFSPSLWPARAGR
jgi:hypothetical protein